MKYVDEFRNGEQAKEIARKINQLVSSLPKMNRPIRFMEVCGGHTHSIFRYGLNQLLPKEIEFIHGPGCPVCVLPMGVVDDAIHIAQHPNVIFTTFGDAIRVPGSKHSLLQAKANGCDVRIVYSPLDALALAQKNPDKEVVFFGLGFETTTPTTALTILQAQQKNITNFSLFCNHITIIPTLRALLESPDCELDGFIGPGHVSMIIGSEPYQFIADEFHKPLVIAGFEPLDILQSVYMLVQQLLEHRCEIENQYQRIVPKAGNPTAMQAMLNVFEPRASTDWRGLGEIEDSGLQIRPAFATWDAEVKFSLHRTKVADPDAAQCGAVVVGNLKPHQCPLFCNGCSPETPIGALMVSTEGACAAAYQYGNIDLSGEKS